MQPINIADILITLYGLYQQIKPQALPDASKVRIRHRVEGRICIAHISP